MRKAARLEDSPRARGGTSPKAGHYKGIEELFAGGGGACFGWIVRCVNASRVFIEFACGHAFGGGQGFMLAEGFGFGEFVFERSKACRIS